MKKTNEILRDTFPAAVNARLLGIVSKINHCSQDEELALCPPATGWGEREEGQTVWDRLVHRAGEPGANVADRLDGQGPY